MIQVHKNFLKEKDFDKIYDFFMKKSDFPWYRSPVLDDMDVIQFTHRFYDNFEPLSAFCDILTPLLDAIKPKALVRIKANLLTRTAQKITHGMHCDVDVDCTTAVYYINENNGETVFENGTRVLSEKNKLVTFPSSFKHSGTTNTCYSKSRIVINFNYF